MITHVWVRPFPGAVVIWELGLSFQKVCCGGAVSLSIFDAKGLQWHTVSLHNHTPFVRGLNTGLGRG